MRLHPRQLVAIVSLLLVPGWSAGARAQASPPSRLEVEIDESCGSESAGDALVAALRARLGGTEIVRGDGGGRNRSEGGAKEGGDAARLRWQPSEGECRLSLDRTGDPETEGASLSLSSSAESDEIRNAASRVAWLLTVRARPPTESTERSSSQGASEDSTTERADEAEGEESASEAEQESPREASDEEAEESGTASNSSGSTGEANAAEDGSDGDDEEPEGRAEEASSAKARRGRFEGGNPVDFRVTLVPGISDTSSDTTRAVPAYSVNVVGRNWAMRGVEMGLIFNTEERYVDGAQFAGVGNWVGGASRGLQTAGVLNVNEGLREGLVTAGVVNVHGGLEGISWAALGGNLVLGDASGLQAAPVMNWTTGEVAGVQLAALNVGRDVRGFQGGLVNVGRRVRGVQMGALNVAKESDVSLGLVNVNWSRPAYGLSWVNETGLVSVGLQHGSEHFRNLFRFGYQPLGDLELFMPGAGFNLHFPVELLGLAPGYLDVDLLYNYAYPSGSPDVAPAHWPQARATVGLRLARRWALFVGTSLNAVVSTGSPAMGPPAALPSIDVAGSNVALWPGLFGGVRF